MAATSVNGFASANLASSSGIISFTIDVPAGSSDLSFTMSGGSGDADMYVRFGAAPTKSTYDCRPYESGNNESFPIANAQAGTYHVMIRAYSAYSGLSLSGTFDGGFTGGNNAPQAVIANGPFTDIEG
jgi:serine protease